MKERIVYERRGIDIGNNPLFREHLFQNLELQDQECQKDQLIKEIFECLEKLIDEEECYFDHHGYCQTHKLEKNCSNKKGQELINKVKEILK